jgi:hypothetical protein
MARKRKITKGDGITERTIEQALSDTPEEMLAAMRDWKRALDDPLLPLRSRIEAARDAYAVWRAENPDSERGDETIPDLLWLVSVLAGPMEAHLKAGRTEWAMRLAGEIAEALALLRIKYAWEPDALRGRAVGNGLKDAAAITNARHAPLRERRFARMSELVPKVGVENAARICEAEELGGWQGIVKQWGRWQNKSDT